MPPRVNKKLLLIIVGVLLVLVVVGTFWVIRGHGGTVRRQQALDDARVYHEAGQKQKERFVYESWIARNPKDTEIRMKLAQLLEGEGQVGPAYNEYRNVIRHDPLNLEALKRVAYYEGQARRWGEMRRVAKVVVDLVPTDAEARLYMAKACLGLGPDYVLEALEHAREAVTNGPKNIDAYLTLAQVHQMRRAPDEVKKVLDEALEVDPKSQELFRFLGNYHMRLGERLKAETAFKAALANADDVVRGHLEMGQFYAASREWQQAETHFRQACDNATTQMEKLSSRTLLGDFYAQRGQPDNALVQYDEALVALPQSPAVLLKKARIFLVQRNSDEARKMAEEVKARGRRDGYHVEALYLSGLAMLREGHLDEAIKELERALTTMRMADLKLGTTEVNLALAQAYLRKGNSGAAREALLKAYAESPGSPHVYTSLAQVLFSRGEHDQVINVLNVPRRPHDADVIISRSYIARGKPEDLTEAEKVLSAAYKRKPDDSSVTLELAHLAERRARWNEAHKYYDETLRLSPDFVVPYLHKARCYEREKQVADAERTYRSGMKVLPDDVRLHYTFALFLSQNNRFADGERLLLDEINRAPENSARRRDYESRLPRYYMAAGQVDKALDWYRERARENPRDLPVRLAIVSIEMMRARYEEAAKTVEEIKAIGGETQPVVLRLEGQLLVMQRKYKEALRRLLAAEEANPNDLDVQYYLGLCYLRSADPAKAQPHIERVAAQYPTNPRVQRALAEVHYSLGNFEEAKRLIEGLRATGEEGLALDIIGADVMTKTGDVEEGEAAWRHFTESSPERSEGWIGLADALWRQGKQPEAIAALTKGYELDGRSFRTTWSLANMHLVRKEFDKAIEVANTSLAAEKDNLALLGLLARLYEMAGKSDEAETVYQRIGELDPANPLPAVARAERAVANGDLAAAENGYRLALRLRPANDIVRNRLISVLMQRDKAADAVIILDTVLRERPEDVGLHILKGRVLLTDQKPDMGIREYKEAIRLSRQAGLEKQNYTVHQELAEVYLRLGRLSEARESFRSTRDLRPDLSEPRLRLAQIAYRQGHIAEARGECLSIIEAKPDLEALVMLGDIALRDKNLSGAREYYDRAAVAFPDEYVPHAKRADLFLVEGKTDEAVAELVKVVELDKYSARTIEVLVGVLSDRKRYDQAITLCRGYLDKCPEPSALHFFMGKIEAARGDYVKAREHLDLSLKERPGVAAAHLAKAQTFLAEKDHPKAIQEARRVLETSRAHEPAYIFMERIYRDEAKLDELEALYREWTQALPDSVIGANNHAWFLVELRKDPDAALRVISGFRDRMTAQRMNYRFGAELDDTEGMAYHTKGDSRRAVELFKKSLAARRDSVRTWEHLRMGYAKLLEEARKTGDEMAAQRYEIEVRKAFTRIRELSPGDFDMQAQLGDVKMSEGKLKEAIEAYEAALDIKKDTTVQQKLVDVLIRDGRLEQAKKHVEDLIKTDPNNAVSRMLEARLLSKFDRHDEAVRIFEDVVKGHPDIVMAHYLLAQEYAESGMMDKGRAELDKTIQLDPKFTGARLVKARLLAAEGKYDEAVTECEAIVKAEPMNFEATFNLGNFQLAQNKVADAEKTFKDMVRRWPDSVVAHERLGETYRCANRPGEALLEFEDARRRNPASLIVLRGLSTVLQSQGKIDRALREYGTYLEDNPQATDAWLDLAMLYVRGERWGDAERAHKSAIKTDRTSPRVHKAMADFYSYRKMFKEARDVGQRMMQDIPSKEGAAMAHTLIARNWELEGKIDEAIQEYRLSMTADPEYAVPVNNLAWLLATKKGQPDEAVKLAEPYLNKTPGFAELFDTVGWAYRLADEPKKAEPILAHAVRVQIARRRVLPTILYHYGEVLHLNGRDAEAKKYLEMALSARFPEYDRAKEIYDKIK